MHHASASTGSGQFYYTNQNEILSVREFMYRLDAMISSKNFEQKRDEIERKRTKIQDVQNELLRKSVAAAQRQCRNTLRKKLASQGIIISDEEVDEMIKKLKFKTVVDDLKLTAREADRQLIAFILAGTAAERDYHQRTQKQIDRAYQRISKPVYFNAFYESFLKRQSQHSLSPEGHSNKNASEAHQNLTKHARVNSSQGFARTHERSTHRVRNTASTSKIRTDNVFGEGTRGIGVGNFFQ